MRSIDACKTGRRAYWQLAVRSTGINPWSTTVLPGNFCGFYAAWSDAPSILQYVSGADGPVTIGDFDEVAFYCDEAGSTGANLLDTAQPVYVTGGWLVPARAAGDFEQTVKLARKHLGVGELKAGRLLRTPSGGQAVNQLILEVMELRAVPFYLIADKTFAVASKIVDVFFDPGTNPSAAWLPLLDDVGRVELAHRFMLLPPPVLAGFLEAYRQPSQQDWASWLDAVTKEDPVAGDADVRGGFQRARDLLDEIFQAETLTGASTVSGAPLHQHHAASVQVPMLAHVLRLVDGFLERTLGRASVCHDRTPKNEAAYQHFFDLLTRLPPSSYKWPSGVHRREGICRLTKLTFADSKSEAGLQAADLLCGIVENAVKDAMRGRKPRPERARAQKALLGLLLDDSPIFARIMASRHTEGQLFEFMGFGELLAQHKRKQ